MQITMPQIAATPACLQSASRTFFDHGSHQIEKNNGKGTQLQLSKVMFSVLQTEVSHIYPTSVSLIIAVAGAPNRDPNTWKPDKRKLYLYIRRSITPVYMYRNR